MKIYLLSPHKFPTRNPRTLRIEGVRKILSQKWTVQTLSTILQSKISNKKYQTNNNFSKTKFARLLKLIAYPDVYIIDNIIISFKYIFIHSNKDNVLITFSHPFSTHFTGLVSKMIWPKRIWIADIGDLYLNNPNQKLPKWVSPLLKCFESLVINKSDYVVLNSEEIFEYYKNNFQLNTLKTRVIYNGSLLNFVGLKSITNNFTNLSFIGNTYENVREGIKELQLIVDTINSLHCKEIHTQIYLAGTQYIRLLEQFRHNPGINFIPALKEIDLLELYQKTNILINFANKNYPGLPSKLYEYMLTGLPIIHFTYGFPDPSIPFLSDYPKFLIFHLELDKPEKLINFILENKNSCISSVPNPKYSPDDKWISLINSLDKH